MDCRVCPDFATGLYRHRGATHASRPDSCAERDETRWQSGQPDTDTDTQDLAHPVSERDAHASSFSHAIAVAKAIAFASSDAFADADANPVSDPHSISDSHADTDAGPE